MTVHTTRFNTFSTILRTLPTATAALSLLLVVAPAQAEGVYVLGSFGQSRFHDDTSRSEKDDVLADLIGFGPDSSNEDTKDTAYKLQVGYQINQYFSVEGGYIDLGQQEYKARFDDVTAKLETSAKGWNIDAVLTLPINAGVSLFAKIGAFNAELEQKLSASASGFYESETEKDTELKAKYGVGVAYNFYQALSARAEVEYFNKLGDKDQTGEVDVTLFSIGLSYQF